VKNFDQIRTREAINIAVTVDIPGTTFTRSISVAPDVGELVSDVLKIALTELCGQAVGIVRAVSDEVRNAND
jgi:hypothetical protein